MAFATDFPATPPPSNNRRVGLFIVLGIVLAIVIVVAVFVLMVRRSGNSNEPAVVPDNSVTETNVPVVVSPGSSTGSTNQPTRPAVVVPTGPPPLNNPAPTKIDESLDHVLTTEEKVSYGFPKEWTVQMKSVIPAEGSPYVTFEVLKK